MRLITLRLIGINKCMNKFPWNNATIVDEIYENEDNYIIKDNPAVNNNNAIVFCSGNGLYFPNNEETFSEIIIKKNRYEWDKLSNSKEISKQFKRVVLIRDIYKQWYVTGINSQANDINSVANKLKELLRDYHITMVGISAGGYAAVTFGKLIAADRIFCISGQFQLNPIEKNPLLMKYKDDGEKNIYYNITSLIENNINGKIFYFYPGRCEEDIIQSQSVKECKNIYPIAVDTDIHGACLRYETFFHIFSCDDREIMDFSQKNLGMIVGAETIFKQFVPNIYVLKYKALHGINMINERFEKK